MKLIAENLTVTHASIRRAMEARDPGPLRAVARLAKEAGATALDVNLGPWRKGLEGDLDFTLEALAGFHHGPLWLDGSDARLMERAAKRWPHPVTLNGYSGNRGREGVLALAAERGLDLVIFLMTDEGIPPTLEGRAELAARLAGEAQAAGVQLERVIIDPLLAPMGWMGGQELNARLLELIPLLPELLGGPVSTVVGLSNLLTRSTAGNPAPGWLEETFLALAAGAGLTHAMVDVGKPGLSRTARALAAFRGERPFAPGEFA